MKSKTPRGRKPRIVSPHLALAGSAVLGYFLHSLSKDNFAAFRRAPRKIRKVKSKE